MGILTLVAGLVCLLVVLLDAFQTIILPPPRSGRFRLTGIFYAATWRPWVFFAGGFATTQTRGCLWLLRASIADFSAGGLGWGHGGWLCSHFLFPGKPLHRRHPRNGPFDRTFT